MLSPLLEQLISDMRCLPGVGPKSAQRMAFHLLQRNRQRGLKLAESLADAMANINHCQRCHNFTEMRLCNICQNAKRDQSQLCIVESAADVLSVEQTCGFFGLYFVLMGHLSPLDGIGPSQLGMEKLQQRLIEEPLQEVILATNPTVEGEATAQYIADLCQQQQIQATRIAYGVPVGSELEFVNNCTLNRAFERREAITD